jgi:tyrosine-protein phosphatase SIW14
MRPWVGRVLGVLVVAAVVGVPAGWFRAGYDTRKRFREVTPGRFYRSGQFSAAGLRQIVKQYGIRSVINLQQENTDPYLPERWLTKPHVRESDLCRELGVRYHLLDGCDKLVDDNECAAGKRPPVIDEYLALLDDEANYPVLLHCKAGLHRTGRLTAIYRMEYENRPPADAMRELKANGYGAFMASEMDRYVIQYVANYRPRPGRGGRD